MLNEERERVFERLRSHQRLPLNTPVIISSQTSSCLGQTENISLGGALVFCGSAFDAEPKNRLRFNLPTGYSITTMCALVHQPSGSRLGLRYEDLDQQSHKELSTFLGSLSDHTRSGERLAKRYSIALSKSRESDVEQLAETIVISPSGGLLVCRGVLKNNDLFFLWWPQGKRGSEAKVVWRRQGEHAGLVEIGFQFENEQNSLCASENFWGLDFPKDLEA